MSKETTLPADTYGRPKTRHVSEDALLREIGSLVSIARYRVKLAKKEGKTPNVWMERFAAYGASLTGKLRLARAAQGNAMPKHKRAKTEIKKR